MQTAVLIAHSLHQKVSKLNSIHSSPNRVITIMLCTKKLCFATSEIRLYEFPADDN